MRKLSESVRRKHATPPGAEARRRVLYVEDERDNYDVISYRLAQSYKILWAQNDREAIELLREHEDELYAVLMDIQLMGSALDGIQLTRAIRDVDPPTLGDLPQVPVSPDIPIIFLTGYISRYSREELSDAGGNALLGKPVDFRELLEALHELGKAREDKRSDDSPVT